MKNLFVGIDIGTSETRIMVTRGAQGAGDRPRIAAIGSAPTRGMRHGYVINQDDVIHTLTQARKDVEQQLKHEITDVYLALQGVGLSSQIISAKIPISSGDNEIKESDLGRIASQAQDILLKKNKNIRIVHMLPLEYALDGQKVLGKPLGMHGTTLEVQILFVTILDHHYEALISVVEQAGMNVIDCIAAPIALGDVTLPRRNKVVGALLLSIGSETTSMAVFEEDTLIDVQVFPIGSHDVTNDLALGFKVDLSTAEKIKHTPGYKDTQKRQREQIIEARLADIFELVEKRLIKIGRHQLLPAGVCIVGGGSHLKGIDIYAQDALEIPVTLLSKEQLHGIFNSKKYNDEKLLTVYGLCSFVYRNHVEESSFFGGDILKSISRFFKNITQEFLP